MRSRRKRTEGEEKRYTRRLLLWAMGTGLLCAGLLVGVLFYFFAPRDNGVYILTVPSFVGKDESDVGRYSDLDIEREWIYSSSTPKGRVISQTPYGGARRKLREGEKYEVKIFVSLGDKTEKVPDLSGVSANSAAAALRALHAKVLSVAIYGEGEDGRVLYTSPPADSEIKAGDTVTMFVSRRRTEGSVEVPDLCGLELAEAYRRSFALGLLVAQSDTANLSAIVVRQSIPAGSRVRRGSYISFMIEEEEKEREWPPIREDADLREDVE